MASAAARGDVVASLHEELANDGVDVGVILGLGRREVGPGRASLVYARARGDHIPMAKRVSAPPPSSTSKKARFQRMAVVSARLPTHEEIAQRAFELYVARGHADGTDVSDWLHAERELAGSAAHGV